MNEYKYEYEELAGAIIRQALIDLRIAEKKLKEDPSRIKYIRQKEECLDFFNSEWFTFLVPCGILKEDILKSHGCIKNFSF